MARTRQFSLLCFAPGEGYALDADSMALKGPDGVRVEPTATLDWSDGNHESSFPRRSILASDLCLSPDEPDSPGTSYMGIRLWANRPVTVKNLRWVEVDKL